VALKIDIQKIAYPDDFPLEWSLLLQESIQEGQRFLKRLELEWQSGENRFDKAGEGLYYLSLDEQVAAIGGINRDPYAPETGRGRIRRFYVRQGLRRQGVGERLLKHIIENHQAFFPEIVVYSEDPGSQHFYEQFGFEPTIIPSKVTHRLKKPLVI